MPSPHICPSCSMWICDERKGTGHWTRNLGDSAFNCASQIKLLCPLGLSFLTCKQGQYWSLKLQWEIFVCVHFVNSIAAMSNKTVCDNGMFRSALPNMATTHHYMWLLSIWNVLVQQRNWNWNFSCIYWITRLWSTCCTWWSGRCCFLSKASSYLPGPSRSLPLPLIWALKTLPHETHYKSKKDKKVLVKMWRKWNPVHC